MKNLLVTLLLAIPVIVTAQVVENPGNNQKIELGIFLGVASHESDVHSFDDSELSYFSELSFSFGIQAKKYLQNEVSLRLQYRYAKIQGFDSNFSAASGHPDRGFSFSNNLNDITLIVDFEPFANKKFDDNGAYKGGIQPYLFAGAGVSIGNSDTDYNTSNQSQALQQLIAMDERDAGSVSISLPVGLGVNLYLSENFSLGFEIDTRIPMSDYLDGVSESGNSEANDYFSTFGIVGKFSLQ